GFFLAVADEDQRGIACVEGEKGVEQRERLFGGGEFSREKQDPGFWRQAELTAQGEGGGPMVAPAGIEKFFVHRMGRKKKFFRWHADGGEVIAIGRADIGD